MNVVDREDEVVEAATAAFIEMAAHYSAATAAFTRGDEPEGDRLAALGADAERRAKVLKREALRLKNMA